MQTPNRVDVDNLGAVLDEELYSRISELELGRNKAIEAYQDTQPWEVESSYIRREIQMRRGRREAHERYVFEQTRLFNEEERGLPTGDFDNFKYMVFH